MSLCKVASSRIESSPTLMAVPYRVFMVEDSPAIRETMRNAVESSGTVSIVGFAETPEDAWQALQSTSVDAVIVDLNLRNGTGFELLSKLRVAPPFAHLVKIVLTNYAAPVFRQRCLALGAQHFFDKSLEFERVTNILDDLAKKGLASGA